MKSKHDFIFGCSICCNVVEYDVSPFDDDNNRIYETECCGQPMERIFSENKSFNICGGAYMRTKYSDSLAVSPRQIAEHKALFPHIPVDSVGRPGFENVKQQDKYLDTCGFVKHTQKIRKLKGETIAIMKRI